MAVLRYGADSSVCLALDAEVAPAEFGAPRGRPLGDPAAAVAEALREPLGYPPLALSTTPGDRVVLVLDRELPQPAQITGAAVNALLEAGVAADGIAVLRLKAADEGSAEDPRGLLPPPLLERIALVTHNPADRGQLAYLATTEGGLPVLVNRALHEADLVLPVGCLHDEATAGYFGIHGVIFPPFSDQTTGERFRSLRSLDCLGNYHKLLADEVDEVAWLLGVNFTIQVVPAAGDAVLGVLAGQSEAVRRQGRRLYHEAWSYPASRQASLVVAAMEGNAGRQTWENFGRALGAAMRLEEDGGAIAVCCDLAAAPGPAVQTLVGARSRKAALEQISRQRPPDALPAALLAEALDRGRVYLLSRLDAKIVEDLDMIPLAAPSELVRLARLHKSCILLSNAPYVALSTDV